MCCDWRPEAEKSGAGGRGRRGLPPYVEAGVPGRGLPLRSAGSYRELSGGGREYSDAADGVQGLLGELSMPVSYDTYEWVGSEGGGMLGGSRIEECRESIEGSYDIRRIRLLETWSGESMTLGDLNLTLGNVLFCPVESFNDCFRGDGPAGRSGKAAVRASTSPRLVFFLRSFIVAVRLAGCSARISPIGLWPVTMASSPDLGWAFTDFRSRCSLRDGPELSSPAGTSPGSGTFCILLNARGGGIRTSGRTYGLLLAEGSSMDVKSRTAAPCPDAPVGVVSSTSS